MVSRRTLALFAGAWSLLNITRTRDGRVVDDTTYGTAPVGVIYYDMAAGFMAALLQSTDPADRPEDRTNPPQANQSDAQWALVGRHSLAYAAPFPFNEDECQDANATAAMTATRGLITHGPLLSSTPPAFVGSLQRRNFSSSGDKAEFLNLVGDLNGGFVDNLWWRWIERDVTFGAVLKD